MTVIEIFEQCKKLREYAQKDQEDFSGPKPPDRGAKIDPEWWESVQCLTVFRADAMARAVGALTEYIELDQQFKSMNSD